MMKHGKFVQVPAASIEQFLEAHRFERTRRGNEVVYVRQHSKNPAVRMAVFTSIRIGCPNARGCGADAIRVVAFYDDGTKSYGLFKARKVLRTGTVEGVLGRVKERLLETAGHVNKRFGF